MGISLSEPTEAREFEVICLRILRDEVTTEALREWKQPSVARLLNHLYSIIRSEFMGGDQEVLRAACNKFSVLLDDHGFAEKSFEQARLTTLRALFHRNSRKYEAAKILAAEVLQAAPDGDWAELRYDARITLADAAVQQGAPEIARENYALALKLAENLGDDVGAARVVLNTASVNLASGNPRQAALLARDAFARFLAADATKLAGWALITESVAFHTLGELEDAKSTADRAKNLFEVMQSKHGLATALGRLGLCHHFALDLGIALDCYNEACEVMKSGGLGDVDSIEIYRAILELDLGRPEPALEQLGELAERTSASGRLPHLFVVRAGMLSAYAILGDVESAREAFDEVEKLFERTSFHEVLVARQTEIAANYLSKDPEFAQRVRAFAEEHWELLRGE